MVVDDAAGPARLASGARDVQEDEDGEVPPAPLALDIDGFIRNRACLAPRRRSRRGVEIKILSLRLATVPLELRSKAG